MKRFVLIGAVVLSVVLGALAVSAQVGKLDPNAKGYEELFPEQDLGDGTGDGRVGGFGGGFGGRGGMRDILSLVAEATGLEVREIIEQVRAGMTLAELITANGGDVNAVSAEVTALVTERVNTAVADGRITQERADALLERLPQAIESALNDTPLQNRIERQIIPGAIQLAAETTGLTMAELRQQLAGVSLATVLTNNGADVNAFIDTLVARAEARVNVAVVDGQITQERANTLIASLRETITGQINTVREGRGAQDTSVGI